MGLLTIDPGLTGGICNFNNGPGTEEIHDIPTAIDGENVVVDVRALMAIVQRGGPDLVVGIELLHDYQKTYRERNADTKWINYGRVLAVLELAPNVVQIVKVPPTSWQRSAEKKDLDSKPESIEKAILHYPHLKRQLLSSGSKDSYNHNRCEAVLIGHHILKRQEGQRLGRRKKD